MLRRKYICFANIAIIEKSLYIKEFKASAQNKSNKRVTKL